MEGRSVELQMVKSEMDSETVDQVDINTEPCTRWSVKQEPEDDASLSHLTDSGGDSLSSSREGMFKFHTVKVEENSLLGIELPPSAVEGDPQMNACRVKEEKDPEKDPLDTAPESGETSSLNDRKSLADETIPIDFIQVKLEDKSSTQSVCKTVQTEFSSVEPGTPIHESLLSRCSIQSIPMPPVAEFASVRDSLESPSILASHAGSDCAGERKRMSAKVSHKRTFVVEANQLDDMAEAKRELVKLQIAIAKKKLKRMRGSTSIAAAEASLRKTQYQIKLQTIKRKYERELEKEKLRAEISRIDMEIKKCILLKKRAQRDSSA